MLFFTADNHFFHNGIINMAGRPFTPENMTERMVELWNDTVGDNDVIYQIGDFSFANYDSTIDVIGRLNGHIRFVIPHDHHDKRWLKKWLKMGAPPIKTKTGMAKYFHQFHVLKLKSLRRDGYSLKISLFHYPNEAWEASFHGNIHLHGHSHGAMRVAENRMDVGVDCHGFVPVSISEVVYELKLLQKGWQWTQMP